MHESEVLVHLGLVDSHPIMSGLDEHDEELTKLHGGMLVLVYGMVGWLSVVTVAAVCIFVGVYVRMSRMSRSLDDAETGSSVSSKSSRLDHADAAFIYRLFSKCHGLFRLMITYRVLTPTCLPSPVLLE